MARISVTLPDNLHDQIIKLAGKEKDSLSYTTSRLVEIGLMVMNSRGENTEEKNFREIEEYCQKLIIQMNGIIKEIAVGKLNFNEAKIAQINNDTLNKFNKLKGVS